MSATWREILVLVWGGLYGLLMYKLTLFVHRSRRHERSAFLGWFDPRAASIGTVIFVFIGVLAVPLFPAWSALLAATNADNDFLQAVDWLCIFGLGALASYFAYKRGDQAVRTYWLVQDCLEAEGLPRDVFTSTYRDLDDLLWRLSLSGFFWIESKPIIEAQLTARGVRLDEQVAFRSV
ncbi:MAG: hypothetical protein ACKVU1_02635 [bacterium]